MIIQLSQWWHTFRYLPRSRRTTLPLFFSGCNVAFRREAIEAVGGFAPELAVCEDIDAGIKVSRHGWLFSNPRAEVVHSSNLSFRKILSQWYLHSKYQIDLMKIHGERSLEIIVGSGATSLEQFEYRCVYARPFAFPITLFLTRFLLFNICVWLTVIALLLHWLILPPSSHPLSWSLGMLCGGLCGTAAAAFLYFRDDFRGPPLPFTARLKCLVLRLHINAILLYCTLIFGLRRGVVCVNFSR